MATVAVTGAAGRVGRVTLAALSDEHTVTPITHRERDLDSIVLDITDRDAVQDAFAGQDMVIHLAGNPSPKADWDSVLSTNIDGTQAVFEAAVTNDVDRVAFASTNHVQHMYNVEGPEQVNTTKADARTVDHDDPFRPDSFYGVSKMAGEGLGSYYADKHGLEVLNLRIGWLMDEEQLLETQSDTPGTARHARAMFWSPRDCRHAMRRVVAADLPENPLTVNLLSRNSDRYFSITHAMRSLDYRPRDDATDIIAAQ
jgi:L-arabinose 1-dehydrogenase [NAD(P)+]